VIPTGRAHHAPAGRFKPVTQNGTLWE
jgi:hypothetical protein